MQNTLNGTILEKDKFHAKHLPYYPHSFIGFSIGFFFSCSAIVANIIVLVMILRKQQQRTPFDLVIASLSLTDFSASMCSIIFIAYKVVILILVSIDFEEHKRQTDTALDAASIFFCLSLVHVLLVTFLRFSALFWPLKFRQFATKTLIKALIAATWTLSVIGGATIIMLKARFFSTGTIIFASGGLVCCANALIAVKICILSQNSHSDTNQEFRVLLNSVGVSITFFWCMLSFACREIKIKVFQNIDNYLALSFTTINLLADPLLYFYFSYWLGKRDEMRRIRNNPVPVQGRDEVQNEDNHV